MQKGAFLIHSRNIHCDFPSTFAVCPPDLSSVEMEQMRSKILSATRFIDSLPPHEVRRLVVSCGDRVLAGVVSFLENMASGDRGDARFFRDKEGRPLYAFIGVVFHTGGQGVPILTLSVLWDKFKQYMEPVWERTLLSTQTSAYEEIDVSTEPFNLPMQGVSVDALTLYPVSAGDDTFFSYYLDRALSGHTVSFCSNVTDFRVVKERGFDAVTTNHNVIERMKQAERLAKEGVNKEEAARTAEEFSQKKKREENVSFKASKSSSLPSVAIIGGLALLVLAVLVLLLR